MQALLKWKTALMETVDLTLIKILKIQIGLVLARAVNAQIAQTAQLANFAKTAKAAQLQVAAVVA